jgi:hypothetical protein
MKNNKKFNINKNLDKLKKKNFLKNKTTLKEELNYNLLKEIKSSKNQKELIKKLEYKNSKIAIKTINKFIETKDIYDWLNNGHYDFKYNSEGFLSTLCILFELDSQECILEINEVKNKIKYINEYNESKFNLKVQTKWIRTNESITILSLIGNSLLNININPSELYGLSDKEELNLVFEKIKLFNKKNINGLSIFGKIEYYKYQNNYGETRRIFIFA